MRARTLMTALAVAVLSGCNGHILTYPNAESACSRTAGQGADVVCVQYDGVLFHRYKQVPQVYELTQITDDKGAVLRYSTGVGDKQCEPVQVREMKTVSESQPSIIQYKPGLFETASFNVELNASGNLVSAGSESTPGGKAFAETVSTLVETARTLYVPPPDDQPRPPRCTAGKLPLGPAS